MIDTAALRPAEILQGLEGAQVAALAGIARPHALRGGEYLFLLGDPADRLFILLSGKAELTFPLALPGTVKDVCVEARGPGSTMGWSALVKPYRFTLSGRAVDSSEFAAFTRPDLERLFAEDPRIGCAFMRRIAEVVGHRLLQMQAVWARELQRAVTREISGNGAR